MVVVVVNVLIVVDDITPLRPIIFSMNILINSTKNQKKRSSEYINTRKIKHRRQKKREKKKKKKKKKERNKIFIST